MAEFIKIATTSDIEPGMVKVYEVAGNQIALCNVDGTFYAVADRCPHQRARLSEAHLEGETIVCPWHGSAFDLRTGRAVTWVVRPRLLHWGAKLFPSFLRKVATCSVRLEGDRVLTE